MSQFAGQNQDGTYVNYNMPYNFSKESMAEFLKKSSASKTPVICKDGTTDFSLSSSNAKYDNSKVCANNGGRAENQTMAELTKQSQAILNQQTIAEVKNPYEVTCKDGTKDVGNGKNPPCIYNGGVKSNANETFIQKHKNHLLIAGAIVLGYFAYKKFIK